MIERPTSVGQAWRMLIQQEEENKRLRAENEAMKNLLREVAPHGVVRVREDLDARIRAALDRVKS